MKYVLRSEAPWDKLYLPCGKYISKSVPTEFTDSEIVPVVKWAIQDNLTKKKEDIKVETKPVIVEKLNVETAPVVEETKEEPIVEPETQDVKSEEKVDDIEASVVNTESNETEDKSPKSRKTQTVKKV